MKNGIDSRFVFLMLMVMSGVQSCSLFEPAKPVAAYVHIDSISVSTDYSTQGSRASKITDVWVIYDNSYLGTFPLPTDIPLMGEGTHSLTLKAGIIENGISGTRAAYPKYVGADTTLMLTAKQKITVQPVVKYLEGTSFAQIEDFDDAALSLVSTSTSFAILEVTPTNDPNAFESNSGMATLYDTITNFEVATANPFILPLNTPSYLELNYKGDNDFTIGIYITTSNGVNKRDLVTVRSSSTWKKIYVNLSDLGGVDVNAIGYKVYLRATKSTLLPAAKLYFDNLKVVY